MEGNEIKRTRRNTMYSHRRAQTSRFVTTTTAIAGPAGNRIIPPTGASHVRIVDNFAKTSRSGVLTTTIFGTHTHTRVSGLDVTRNPIQKRFTHSVTNGNDVFVPRENRFIVGQFEPGTGRHFNLSYALG